jgi:hypothetical protein
MSTLNIDTDLTISLIPEAARKYRGPVPLAAYVPIAVALVGVFFILVGGINARLGTPSANSAQAAIAAPASSASHS